jgi:hypothetical protein
MRDGAPVYSRLTFTAHRRRDLRVVMSLEQEPSLFAPAAAFSRAQVRGSADQLPAFQPSGNGINGQASSSSFAAFGG